MYIRRGREINTGGCYPCLSIHAYIPLLCLPTAPEGSDTAVAMSTPSTHILVSKHLSPRKGTRAPQKNGAFRFRAGKGKCKKSLVHLMETENKEVFKK